jgi:hypothetical protein
MEGQCKKDFDDYPFTLQPPSQCQSPSTPEVRIINDSNPTDTELSKPKVVRKFIFWRSPAEVAGFPPFWTRRHKRMPNHAGVAFEQQSFILSKTSVCAAATQRDGN